MTVEVVGLLGGNAVDRTMLVLRSPVPTQEGFNWSGVDGVRFVPQTSACANGKLQFALSQMVINGVTASLPEPGSMLLLGSGLGLAITRLRRLRQSTWLECNRTAADQEPLRAQSAAATPTVSARFCSLAPLC